MKSSKGTKFFAIVNNPVKETEIVGIVSDGKM